MKNIVVTIDFSAHSKLLSEQAAVLARQFQAKLWLLHVAAPNPEFVGYEAGPQNVREARARELRKEHEDLQQMAAFLQQTGINAESLLIAGRTAETIAEEATKLQADLIVVGFYEHSIFYDLWFGNNTTELIKRTTIPVLVVPLSQSHDQ